MIGFCILKLELNENLLLYFFRANDIKIFGTVNLQLTVHFHNPTWMPFAVGVLLTILPKLMPSISRRINTINPMYKLW